MLTEHDGPCRKCSFRHELCWDSCELYKEFRKMIQKANENRNLYSRGRTEEQLSTVRLKDKTKF